MRRFLLLILIALLPLQSFAGLGMAVRMASSPSTAAELADAHSHKMVNPTMSMRVSGQDAPNSPCHEALQDAAMQNQDCCGNTALCLAMCQALAFFPMQGLNAASTLPQALVGIHTSSFSSADLALRQKPPLL